MNPIVFYDGECGFCHYWVQWILDRDRNRKFRFCSLQSDFAERFFVRFNRRRTLSSIVVFTDDGKFLDKSRAVSYILSCVDVSGVYRNLLKIAPRFLADGGYVVIAKLRKKIVTDACRVFSEEEKRLFLNETEFFR